MINFFRFGCSPFFSIINDDWFLGKNGESAKLREPSKRGQLQLAGYEASAGSQNGQRHQQRDDLRE